MIARRSFLRKVFTTTILFFPILQIDRLKSRQFVVAFDTPVTAENIDVLESKELSKWQNRDLLDGIMERYRKNNQIIGESVDLNKIRLRWQLTFKSELDYWAWERELEIQNVFDFQRGAEKVKRKIIQS